MLKILVDDIKDIENILELLKQEPEFILDNNRDIKENDELPINLYYVKIGDYYLFDNDYVSTVAIDDVGYTTILTEIGITRDSSKALHVEDWEIEHIKQGLKGEIEILKIEKENE